MHIHIDIDIGIVYTAMSVNKCQAGLLAKGRAASAAVVAADATVNRLLEWKSIQKCKTIAMKKKKQ